MGGRAFVARMRAIGQAIPGCDIGPLVVELLRRIHRMRRNGSGNGAYLFGDSEGYVYLLRADSGVTDRMVSELPRMVVGLYLSVTPEQLAEDLTAHFVSVGYVTEQAIRNAVCAAEG